MTLETNGVKKGDETQRLEREVLEKYRRASPTERRRMERLLKTEIVRVEQAIPKENGKEKP